MIHFGASCQRGGCLFQRYSKKKTNKLQVIFLMQWYVATCSMWFKCNNDALILFSTGEADVYVLRPSFSLSFMLKCCSLTFDFNVTFSTFSWIHYVIVAPFCYHFDFVLSRVFMGIHMYPPPPAWRDTMAWLGCKICILHTLLEVCLLVLLDLNEEEIMYSFGSFRV